MREKSCVSNSRRRPRPHSEIITSNISATSRARPVSDSDVSSPRDTRENLVMYVVGGREVGQINMFQRNISIWKLQL